MRIPSSAQRWLRSPHLRPILLLASGAGLSQTIALVLTPVITRLYLPSDYGTMALYMSIVAIVAGVAGGRYESAVCLPRETGRGERAAIGLVRVAIAIAGLTFLLVSVVIVGLSAWGNVRLLDDLGVWRYAVPVGVFVASASATLSQYATRRRRYEVIARIAPVQRIASSAIQLAGGVVRLGLSGLMLGAVVTPFVGLGLLIGEYRTGAREAGFPPYSRQVLLEVAREYSDFLKISTMFALLNSISLNIQTIVLAHYYPISDVGQFALATAIIGLPTGLILGGVTQVYQRECAARAHDRIAAAELTRKTLKALLLTSGPMFLLLFVASRYLFGFVFGPDWTMVGAIGVAMIPLAWARFITVPLTLAFNVYRRQGVLLAWQVATLASILVAFTAGGNSGLSVVGTTWLASGLTGPMYLLLVPMVFRIIRSRGQRQTLPH